MPKTENLDKLSIEELQERHAALYRDRFAPTLREYSAMAAEALALQVALYKARFAVELPGVKVRVLPKVLTFAARENPAALDAMLAQIKAAENVAVSEIVFDPARNEFHLFARLK